MSIAITNNQFVEKVLNTEGPVLVDFWAPWCGPCRMLSPVVEEISEQYAGQLQVVKINVDEEPALAAHFQITSIPTLMLFQNGEAKAVSVGMKPKRALCDWLAPYIG